jgi:predicted  nucleic acid-binding Zn-ribbon protein
MKAVFVVALLLGSAAAVDVNPVSKVIQLLGSLEAKITKNGQAETKAYNEYAAWCKDGAKDLNYEIKTGKSDIEDLTATIGKAGSDIAAASSKIEELSGDTTQNAADLKAATSVRSMEKTEYDAAEKELVDVVDTLDRAINILEKKLRGSALVQANVNTNDVAGLVHAINAIVDAASMSVHDKNALVSLAQSAAEDGDALDEVGAPAPEAYKSKSKSIVEVLEDMRAKAASQLKEVQTQEVSAKHNFQLLKQSLEDQMAADEKEIGESKSTKAGAQSTAAVAQGELAKTQESLAASEKTLSTMDSGCRTAGDEHDASVKATADELKALAAAKKVLSENTGAATSKVYSFLQNDENQRTAITTRADLANIEVVNLLRELAHRDGSAALSQLASRVSAAVRFGSRNGEDPFAKVKSMIKEMVDRLQKEGAEEATHKAWCDEQMGETKQKTLELNHDIEGFTAKMDKAKSRSIKLKDEVAGLQSALADLAKSQAELDGVRREENGVFKQTKSDLEAGLKGVRMALKVLKEYYANGAGFVQTSGSKAQGAGDSIIGMLEVVESDFGKSLATSEAEEDAGAVDYEKVSMNNRLNKAQWSKDVEYKTKEFTSLDKSFSELTSDRDSAQSELDAVLEYSKSVRGSCELKPETYGDRKGRREDEVAGLKEALKILEGESVFLQTKSLRGVRTHA